VAAGTGVLADQQVDELMPLPESFTGAGNVFMLKVRGESMIDLGIFDGDYVVVREQQTAENGEIVVAGIPGEEATVKTLSRTANSVVLIPANEQFSPMEFSPDEVVIYGKVVTVIRSL
jgi:repressor LexA